MNITIDNNKNVIYEMETLRDLKPKYLYCFMKRFFDIVLASIGLAFLAIPMILIAIIIKLGTRGPVIVKQDRLGKNGELFTLYRFRTRQTISGGKGQGAQRDDPPVTWVGRFIQKRRLDNLPQLWNVLRGEMSFVGPRPERARFYADLEASIRGLSQRLLVVPGLTGYAQVNEHIAPLPYEKILLDLYYIRRGSLWLDIKCLSSALFCGLNHLRAK